MRPKILLTGKNGQVGGELQRFLPAIGDTIALGRHELDLADSSSIRRMVRDVRPNLIVNAAAYTAVDQAESNVDHARAINTEAVSVLAEEAKKNGAALVHYSTDYVFDGNKKSPYEETDSPNALNVYGRTKLAGETAIKEAGIPHFIFRTEWVYAKRGKNFLLTILRLATQKEELCIVNDQIGAPTYSGMIAAVTAQILSQVFSHPNGLDFLEKLTGIYHLTAAGETTWFGFAQAILEELSALRDQDRWLREVTGGRPLICRTVRPICTSDYPTPARRPSYSLLSVEKIHQVFGIQLLPWRTQLHLLFENANESGGKDFSVSHPA